jgi:miniconductance mechanosensitive channel
VKVRNWDKTITSIPSYALIADSFKNWRGITEAGGRRIKRSFNIDVGSVHFLGAEEIERLRAMPLLSEYLERKLKEIDAYNHSSDVDARLPLDGRRLTNLGTLRAYLTMYLNANEALNQDLTLMVRQLAPAAEGIPLEVYCFTRTTDWVPYEDIQSDIFDHILATIPAFNLRLFQNPTGQDFRQLTDPG